MSLPTQEGEQTEFPKGLRPIRSNRGTSIPEPRHATNGQMTVYDATYNLLRRLGLTTVFGKAFTTVLGTEGPTVIAIPIARQLRPLVPSAAD